MTLSILSVAYPLAPVRDSAAGGAEQVLHSLDRELTARGHHSAVVARQDSEVAGTLFPASAPAALYTDQVCDTAIRAHQTAIDRALAHKAVDLLHMHGIDFHRYRLPRDLPVIVTLHLPPSWYPEHIWDLPADVHFVCVSASQRNACSRFTSRPLTVIHNGVSAWPSPEASPAKQGGYALMLSRVCPEKNLHVGLDAARLAGIPVLLAGETYPYETHLHYLRSEIEPRLGPDAQLLPSVGGAKKQRLLAEARCLLLPTLAPETSSLVAMEALHAGTPGSAFPSGAVPEIVRHGRTGFLVSDASEMAAAIARSSEIDPAVCRAVAREHFSLDRMVDNYLALYTKVLNERCNPAQPLMLLAEAH